MEDLIQYDPMAFNDCITAFNDSKGKFVNANEELHALIQSINWTGQAHESFMQEYTIFRQDLLALADWITKFTNLLSQKGNSLESADLVNTI